MNTQHGDLRVAHFVGMHALQVLPLLALALTALGHDRLRESTRLRVLALAAAGYVSVTGLTLWQALRGQSVVHPDARTLTTATVLVVVGLAHAATTVRHERSRRRTPA